MLSKLNCLVVCGSLALVAALDATAAPVQSDLPPLVDPASQEHHTGKFIFVQLVTPDMEGAKAFYGSLFGWSFRDLRLGDTAYAEALLENRPVAGIVLRPIKSGEKRQPAWLGFISAPDVGSVIKTAREHGGKVLFQPRDVPDLGREAVLADPQGAVFAVLASSSGDPPDVLAGAGEWIWSSLITTDPDADAGFYQALFGYEVFEAEAVPDQQHYTLASDEFARASVNSLPASGISPHWLQYVRVADAVKTAAQVVSLGGRVLVEPRPNHQGGKVAVVADPSGAPFGLLEWPESDSKEIGR